MTMIIAAHLKDHLLIAADRRAMSYDLVTGSLSFANDQQRKIQTWAGGVIAGTGEKVFLDRVILALQQFNQTITASSLLKLVMQQLALRRLDGIPITSLANNTIFITQYTGSDCLLYSIPIGALIDLDYSANSIQDEHYIHALSTYAMQVTCLNIPQDFTQLQQFQANLKPISDFDDINQALGFYGAQLDLIFKQQAAHDSSVSPDFDLYLQNCHTGRVLCYKN